MPTIRCKLCGCSDIVCKDDVFICQNCGCKYSLDDAKRLLSDTDESFLESSVVNGTYDAPYTYDEYVPVEYPDVTESPAPPTTAKKRKTKPQTSLEEIRIKNEKRKKFFSVALPIVAIILIITVLATVVSTILKKQKQQQLQLQRQQKIEQLAKIRENTVVTGVIAAGDSHTVGLKADGTVVATGDNGDGQCNVSDWKDIVAVSVGRYYTIGLKADGTVVATGDNGVGQCNVSDWKDIVAVAAGDFHTVGLKADGTVVETGDNNGPRNVSGWKDIVAVVAGKWHTIGLKADGTVVATGDNPFGECNVADWKDIVAVAAGSYHTIGLKADGTVVATGNNDDGQCNVSDWKIKTK